MSNYGKNFGFRWIDDKSATRQSRYRMSATVPGSGHYQVGSLVTLDPAHEGFLAVAGANADLVPGLTGLLISEDEFIRSIYETDILDSFSYGQVKPGKQVQLVTGPGVKVWLKNTVEDDRLDGRIIPAVTVLGSLAGRAIGDVLVWDGSKYVPSAAGTAHAVATITAIDNSDTSQGYCEAVLLT
jgi:hypothetical protein